MTLRHIGAWEKSYTLKAPMSTFWAICYGHIEEAFGSQSLPARIFSFSACGVPAGGLPASFLHGIGLLLECGLLGPGLVPLFQPGYKVIKLLGPGHYLPVVRTPLS